MNTNLFSILIPSPSYSMPTVYHGTLNRTLQVKKISTVLHEDKD